MVGIMFAITKNASLRSGDAGVTARVHITAGTLAFLDFAR
jgi:hypothetical protein